MKNNRFCGAESLIATAGFLLIFALSASLEAAENKANANSVPEIPLIQTLQKEYEPARFGHKIHLEKTKACATCHHHSSAEETRKCGECHDMAKMAIKEALLDNFLPCKSCHRKYSPDSPSMPGLLTAFHAQCFSCHKVEGPKACEKMCHARAAKGG